MFVALVSFAATAFVGCTDNEDDEIKAPTLTASPLELQLSEESPRGTVEVKADCQWRVNAPDWVDVTPSNGRGSMAIEVSVDPEIVQEAKSGTISFTLMHDTYGEWGKADSKVKVIYTYQGSSVEPGETGELVYGNNFDKELVTKTYGNSSNSFPYLDQSDCWMNPEGPAAEGATYTYVKMSTRTYNGHMSDSGDSAYDGSGVNCLFFGADGQMTFGNLAIETNKLQLQFGAEKYSQDYGNLMAESELLVTLSTDGQSWSNPITYMTNPEANLDGVWNLFTADFTLPEGTTTLYVKFSAKVPSSYRLDDFKLFEGEGGQLIEFNGTDTPVTPSDVIEATVQEFLDAPEDPATLYQLTGTIKGTYNTSYGNFYLEDATGEVLIYGLLTPSGEKQKQYQAAGLKDGDIITLYGARASYNGNPQMKDATYVSHEAGQGGSDDPVVPAEGIYASDTPFVCTTDDSTNAAYSLGDTTIGDNAVTGFKLGKSKQAGKFTSGAVGVSGEKYLNFYAVGWKNGNVTLYYRVDGGATQSQKLAANNGASDNPPYVNLSFAETDHYSVKLTGLTATSTIEFSTDANFELTTADATMATARAIVCGVKLTDEPLAGETPDQPDQPDQPEQPTGVTTIAEILALGKNATIESATIEGVVISNMALNNLTSKKGLYVQDATGGLQFYMAANHEFAFGDKLKIDLSGATLGDYNGAVQISGLALDKVEVLSSGNTVAAKTVTMADFLANKYEGQYIALEGVQVASADLSKTWVMGDAHTSINMEDANGNSFVVFSSKYATYGAETVAQGSGVIKGISSINNGKMQLIFGQTSDYAGLTGERFGGTVTPEPPTPGEIQKVTVQQFLNAEVNADVWYELTGVVRNLANTTYGNFDLVDESGSIYVYGLTATKVASNDKSFSSLGIEEYDTVTLIGTRDDHNGTAQVGGPAYYVSHVDGEAPDLGDNVATISFADKDNRTSFSTQQQVWEQNGITVTNDKGSSTSNVADYAGPVRFYKNSNVTISAEKAMEKIVIYTTGDDYNLNLTAASGYTVEGSGSATVTITLNPAVTSFTITGLANQIRVSKIEVTFAE